MNKTTKNNKRTSRHWDWDRYSITLLLAVLATIICIAVCFGRAISKASNRTEYVVVVNDKWTKRASLNKDKYLVSVTDIDNESEQMVFEITDSLFAWRWDSSDLYAKIEPGKIYRMVVGGGRVPIFSWYPNIYEADQIDVVIDETESEKGALSE